MAPPMTATRRGLVLTVYSEGPLVLGALVFLVFPTRPVFLVWGIILSLVFGGPAGLAFWAGRREFGPAFRRGVLRANVAFAVLLLSLLFAFFEITSVFPDSMKLRDLYGPWFLLGLALAADAAAMILLLQPLLLGKRPWMLHAIWILAVVGAAAYFFHGKATVNDFVMRSGGEAFVPAEAHSYARDFVSIVVRDWVVALLALRIGFWPALYRALMNVATAEDESARRVREMTLPADA